MMTGAELERFTASNKERAEITGAMHQKMLGAVVNYRTLGDLPEIVKDQLALLNRDSRKPKVLCLYNGGTVGMHPEMENGKVVLKPTTDEAGALLEPLKRKGLDEKMQVVWFPIWRKPIDSTNGRWPHWVSYASAAMLLYDYFDGMVDIGGTDTKSYRMGAYHYTLPNFGKPLVGVSGQKEMTAWGDDGTENLSFGLWVAAHGDISGAHAAFRGKLRHGLHLFKVRDKSYEAFDCPTQYILGEYQGEDDFIQFPNAPRRNPLVNSKNLIFNPDFRDGILVPDITPFTYAESLLHAATDPLTLAILLKTYGAGNVRDEALFEGETTYVDVIQRLHERQFPIVLGSPMQDGVVLSPYASGERAIDAGAISGGDTTGATLPIKIAKALANSWWTEERREQWRKSLPVTITHRDEFYRLSEPFMWGVDYAKFREEMYRSHVGELTANIVDRVGPGQLRVDGRNQHIPTLVGRR